MAVLKYTMLYQRRVGLSAQRRTMTNGENRYSVATKSGVIIEEEPRYGLFLYPDNYDGKIDFSSMTLTWKDINDAGIVFLPAAGQRDGDSVSTGYYYLNGDYWTSSSAAGLSKNYIYIRNDDAVIGSQDPTSGCSLRLVTDAQ